MITTGAMISAADALNYGLVNHVVPLDELISFCEDLAEKISRNSPNAIEAAIQAINANFEDGVNGFKTEIEAFGNCFGTSDFIEGTSAFIEKRKPNF
jgi:enoyl-CoA hydratase